MARAAEGAAPPPVRRAGLGPRALRVALAAVLAAALVVAGLTLPIGRWTLSLVDRLRGAGALGVLAFAAAYVAATVLMAPGAVLTLGAGFAYGPWLGVLIASPASVLGATLAFLLGRSVARPWVGKRVQGNPRFAAVDEAVGRRGFLIVALLRLSPVFPFNLLNYALGLTRVSLGRYVVASFLGMLPGTFLYVYLGSLVTSASEILSSRRPSGGPWATALYWGGLGANVVVSVLITRVARRALGRELASTEEPKA